MGSCMTVKENYDLMKLVVIRLGQSEFYGQEADEGYHLLRFLNAIMYPHKKEFMDIVSDYIDFSDNQELWQEVHDMFGLGQSILEEGREEGRELGIQALVTDHLEENIPRERSIVKLLLPKATASFRAIHPFPPKRLPLRLRVSTHPKMYRL